MTTPLSGDALVADNQKKAAALGVSIPGVGGGTPVITATRLQSNPQPMNVPPPPPNTAGAALSGAIGGQSDAWTAQLASNTAAAKTSNDQSLDALITALTEPGKAGITDAAYKSAGVDEAQAGLNEANNAIITERNALNQRIAELKKNAQGYFGTGLDQEIQKATDESNARQANLAIIQLSKQGQFDSAKAIADRAVAAQTEAEQNKINALQAIYEANKDEFSDAEKEQFAAAQADRQNELDTKKAKILADYDEIIKKNDPLYQAQVREALANAQKTESEITPSGATEKDLETVNSINTILNSPAFDSTFGLTNILNRNLAGSDAYGLAQNINNLTSNLALAARGQLKGQGQVSDFEGKLLRDAQTALTLNMSPAQARAELVKVRGAIRTSSGLSAPVKITDSNGNVKYGDANQQMINDAISQGYTVEYTP